MATAKKEAKTENTEKKIEVTLTRSVSGRLKKQERTIRALGLHKIGETKVFPDTAAVRGMINVVSHMVSVKEVQE
ncbi:50S ribosomal protein L30 [Clostridia bacterium]|nr:50S ribosomal protein L30 [Clostridia bacterium]